jgi:hypothetical protein
MREETRRAAVYIAATKVAAKQKGLIYDHDCGRYTVMSGDSSHAFDHEARAHITESGDFLYHHGTQSYISLTVNGCNFSGYDYRSNGHFMGSVRGGTVQLYDYAEGRYFNYNVS